MLLQGGHDEPDAPPVQLLRIDVDIIGFIGAFRGLIGVVLAALGGGRGGVGSWGDMGRVGQDYTGGGGNNEGSDARHRSLKLDWLCPGDVSFL